MDFAEIAAALAEVGLTARGGFAVEEEFPPLPDGRAARFLLLIGNVGPAMWRHFAADPTPAATDPLDHWTRKAITPIARRFAARALFPFDQPAWPFLRWLRRAEPCHPSPIGMLIHPRYGLWHGLRGALLLGEALDAPPRDDLPSPCESCADRPCLSGCPVGAFRFDGKTHYDVPACVGALERAGSQCRAIGCLARHACPIGQEFRPSPEQARFHMDAFVTAMKRS